MDINIEDEVDVKIFMKFWALMVGTVLMSITDRQVGCETPFGRESLPILNWANCETSRD